MSARNAGSPEYFADNADLLSEIAGHVGRLSLDGQVVMTVDHILDRNPRVVSVSGRFTEDVLDELGEGIDDDVAESLAAEIRHIWTVIAQNDAWSLGQNALNHRVNDRGEIVPRSGDAEEFASASGVISPSETTTVDWRQSYHFESDTGFIVMPKFATLVGNNGETWMEMAGVTLEDGLIRYHVDFRFMNDKPFFIYSFVEPVHDELYDRVVTTVSPEHLKAIAEIMVGDDPGNAAARLSEIREAYRITSKEQEIRPLLDEVLIRHLAAIESLKLVTRFGIDLPAMQELILLRNYLADMRF